MLANLSVSVSMGYSPSKHCLQSLLHSIGSPQAVEVDQLCTQVLDLDLATYHSIPFPPYLLPMEFYNTVLSQGTGPDMWASKIQALNYQLRTHLAMRRRVMNVVETAAARAQLASTPATGSQGDDLEGYTPT